MGKLVVFRGAVLAVALMAALWAWLLRPLSKRISLTTVTRWVEEHHPEMQERIWSRWGLRAGLRRTSEA